MNICIFGGASDEVTPAISGKQKRDAADWRKGGIR